VLALPCSSSSALQSRRFRLFAVLESGRVAFVVVCYAGRRRFRRCRPRRFPRSLRCILPPPPCRFTLLLRLIPTFSPSFASSFAAAFPPRSPPSPAPRFPSPYTGRIRGLEYPLPAHLGSSHCRPPWGSCRSSSLALMSSPSFGVAGVPVVIVPGGLCSWLAG
jgi:hypothetical protein